MKSIARRLRGRSPQRGQALLETLLLGLLLLVPLVWALGVLADLHRSALAVTSATREAGFDAARESTLAAAGVAVDRAVIEALVNQGLEPGDARVRWSASRLERGGVVEVRVGYPVTVVQAPLLGRVAGPAIWVEATHFARIDPYASRP